MDIGNLELTPHQVNPNGITENDRTTYAESVRDVINLDAVVVAPSGNIDVSPCFPLTSYTSYDRND